jgi:hypothetical protein
MFRVPFLGFAIALVVVAYSVELVDQIDHRAAVLLTIAVVLGVLIFNSADLVNALNPGNPKLSGKTATGKPGGGLYGSEGRQPLG